MSFNPENFFLKRMGNCDFKNKYKNYTFLKSETLFGRGKDCDFILKNKRCSLIHCKITFENGKIFVEDSSSAGTFVNNVKIRDQKVELFENTTIGMGADPNRQEHVDKTDFYIYKVQKVEAPISLDSSDDEEADENQNIEDASIVNVNDIIAGIENLQNLNHKTINNEPKSNDKIEIQGDLNDVVCLDNNENIEDLTQKIDEHLTADEELKLEAQIKEKTDLGASILGILRSKNKNADKISTPDPLIIKENSARCPRVSVASTIAVPSSPDSQPEWISSAFIPPTESEMNVKKNEEIAPNLLPEAALETNSNLSTQPIDFEPESSELPPEPPIFAPGFSNFQPFPSHLAGESPRIRPSVQAQIEPLNIAETPNYLPSPTHLTPATITLNYSAPERKHSNLALRKKVLPSASNSSTSTPPISFSSISSESNQSSSDKQQTYSRSNSALSSISSASLPSSEDQSKTLTPDELKAKTNFLRHYGQQCSKLIDIPDNPMNQTSDLLDEVEVPKETEPIFWKRGVAMVKTVRKPKKKRGRPKAEDKNDDKKSENSEKSEPKLKKSKTSDITSKNEDKALKTRNANEDPTSESLSPTKLKPTARKTTNTGSIAAKRPFACVNDNKQKSEDSDSSNDYESAKSENSESENQEKGTKRRKISSSSIESSESKTENQDKSDQDKTEAEKSSKNYKIPKINASVPTTSNSKKLFKFPDSDEDNSNDKEPEPVKIVPKKVGIKIKKIGPRRESIINLKRPGVQKKLAKIPKDLIANYVAANQRPSMIKKRITKVQQDEPAPNEKSPTKKLQNQFFHLYRGLLDTDSNPDAGPSSPSTPKTTPKKINRRLSVFDEQAQLIPGNLTPNERANRMRRWNQNTTKLIDGPMVDPNKKRRPGRPKLNEDEKIKMLVEKSKANEEKK